MQIKTQYIASLDDPRAQDISFSGGKGVNLNQLINAGFVVPAGFILGTDAYEAFVAENSLAAKIKLSMQSVLFDDVSTVQAAAQAIQTYFRQATIPANIATAIQGHYQQLNAGDYSGTVAVRSSATTEDMPHASFAGQHDTCLNVIGAANLLAAIKQCWASLWSTRAIAYRAQQKIAADQAQMAVVVQTMVPAEISGVLFTLDPITGQANKMMVNLVAGLGEPLVSGAITPHSLYLDKETAQIIVEPETPVQALLTQDHLAELAQLGREIEAYFDCPQDIEWAWAAGQFHLLQSRPITAISQQPRPTPQPMIMPLAEIDVPGDDHWLSDDETTPQPFDLWTRANFGEVLPYPVSPLTLSGFHKMGKALEAQQSRTAPEIQMVRRLYGRIYANEGGIRYLMGDLGLPTAMVDSTWGSRRPDLPPQSGFQPRRFLRKLPKTIRGSIQMKQQTATTDALPQKPETCFAQIDDWVAAFQATDLTALSDTALWKLSQAVWETRYVQMGMWHMRVSQLAFTAYMGLERLVRWWTKDATLAQSLVTGLSGLFAAQMGVALWQIAQQIKALNLTKLVLDNAPEDAWPQLQQSSAATSIAAALNSFLETYGHRCPSEPELILLRWCESPVQVMTLIAGYLSADEPADPAKIEARLQAQREATTARIEAQLDPLRRRIFRAALKKAQNAVRTRDNSRHFLAKVGLPRRLLYLALGERLQARGWLEKPDDIFFLLHQELETLFQDKKPPLLGEKLRDIVDQRRLAYEFWFTVIPPEAIGADGQPLPDPTPPSTADLSDTDTIGTTFILQGVPASSGRVQGRARLIDNPQEADRVQPGDILVTRATDPGWTPIFPLVAGLVLEIGGQLSHGAIIAREYGAPAVVNVYGAMQQIQDGDLITIDGAKGWVAVNKYG